MRRTVTRFHDFCYGHRVYRHESRCQHLHGHGGRVFFTVSASKLDDIGRIIDFGEINKRLCNWIEENWDHRLLLWNEDPFAKQLWEIDHYVQLVPFNPTAENLAEYLCTVVGPARLAETGVTLTEVKFYETPKCSATFYLK